MTTVSSYEPVLTYEPSFDREEGEKQKTYVKERDEDGDPTGLSVSRYIWLERVRRNNERLESLGFDPIQIFFSAAMSEPKKKRARPEALVPTRGTHRLPHDTPALNYCYN